MEPTTTDLVVIGAGPGGYAAAFYAADKGKIELIKELVWEHLQMDRFLEAAAEARFA